MNCWHKSHELQVSGGHTGRRQGRCRHLPILPSWGAPGGSARRVAEQHAIFSAPAHAPEQRTRSGRRTGGSGGSAQESARRQWRAAFRATDRCWETFARAHLGEERARELKSSRVGMSGWVDAMIDAGVRRPGVCVCSWCVPDDDGCNARCDVCNLRFLTASGNTVYTGCR